MTTATKESLISTTGSRSAYGDMPYQSSFPSGYKTAKPPKTPRPRPAPEPPLPRQTSGALAKRVIILKAVAHGGKYAFIQKADSPSVQIQQLPLARRAPSPERTAKRIEAQKALAKDTQLRDYLERVSTGERAIITPETASRAMKAWITLWMASGYSMAAPAACTGPDGEMFYSWDRGRHHLELEIIPGEPAEFFYRDRETEQFWGEDYNIGERLPAAVVAKLSIFR